MVRDVEREKRRWILGFACDKQQETVSLLYAFQRLHVLSRLFWLKSTKWPYDSRKDMLKIKVTRRIGDDRESKRCAERWCFGSVGRVEVGESVSLQRIPPNACLGVVGYLRVCLRNIFSGFDPGKCASSWGSPARFLPRLFGPPWRASGRKHPQPLL